MPWRLQAVPGTNTLFATFQATLPRMEEDSTVQWSPHWVYHRRGPQTDFNHLYTWQDGRWPNRTSFTSDPASGLSCPGREANGHWSGNYQPWVIGFGTPSQKFIMGTVKDESLASVSGAVVQIFRTSDDLYVGETTSDSNGRYEAGTPHAGLQHYLVAYRAGSPDIAGTTVNTLTPTNRDGT